MYRNNHQCKTLSNKVYIFYYNVVRKVNKIKSYLIMQTDLFLSLCGKAYDACKSQATHIR